MKIIFNVIVLTSIILISNSANNQMKSIVDEIKSLLSLIPKKIYEINESRSLTNELIQTITGTGYEEYINMSEVMTIEELDSEYFSDFLDSFLNDFKLPKNYIKIIKRNLMETVDSNDSGNWKRSQFIYSNNDKNERYTSILILLKYDQVSKTIDLAYTKTSSQVKLSPDLLIFKTTDVDGMEKISIEKEERQLNNVDIKSLLTYFEIVSIKKLSSFFNVKRSNSSSKTSLRLLNEEPSMIQSIAGDLNVVTSTWTSIVSAFKTTRSNVLKERIEGKGFNTFHSTSISDCIEGLEGSMIDEYLADFKSIVKLPHHPELNDMFLKSVKWVTHSSQKMFSGNNIAFTQQDGGRTAFVTFLHRKNRKNNTYDIIYSFFTADFTLAPQMWIWNKGLSLLGGIYENHEDYVKYVPSSITLEDIKGVMAFSQLVNMKEIYAQLGFGNLNVPSV